MTAAAAGAARKTTTFAGSTVGMGLDRDPLTITEWDRKRAPAEKTSPGRASVPRPVSPPEPAAASPPSTRPAPEPAESGGGGASWGWLTRRPTVGGDGGGLVLAVVFWLWVGLPFLAGGPTAVRNVWRAKWFNRGPDGEWLP